MSRRAVYIYAVYIYIYMSRRAPRRAGCRPLTLSLTLTLPVTPSLSLTPNRNL